MTTVSPKNGAGTGRRSCAANRSSPGAVKAMAVAGLKACPAGTVTLALCGTAPGSIGTRVAARSWSIANSKPCGLRAHRRDVSCPSHERGRRRVEREAPSPDRDRAGGVGPEAVGPGDDACGAGDIAAGGCKERVVMVGPSHEHRIGEAQYTGLRGRQVDGPLRRWQVRVEEAEPCVFESLPGRSRAELVPVVGRDVQ